MASKLQKQQPTGRWAESGIAFAPSYVQQVGEFSAATGLPPQLLAFGKQLAAFVALRTTRQQVDAVKGLAAPLLVAAAADGPGDRVNDSPGFGNRVADAMHQALRLAVALLFQSNARPGHRKLLAQLAHLPPLWLARVCDCIQDMVLGIATQQDAGAAAVGSGLAGGSQLPLAEVTPSLLEWRPLQGGHVKRLAVPLVACLSAGVARAADDMAVPGRQLPAALLDESQDAVAALYILLQREGAKMAEGANGGRAIAAAAEAVLALLKAPGAPRDVLGSAAVVLATAAALPPVPPCAAASELAAGLFPCMPTEAHMLSGGRRQEGQDGIVPAALAARGSTLAAELRGLSSIARICSIKGVLSSLPAEALCANLMPSAADAAAAAAAAAPSEPPTPMHSAWTFLVNGAVVAALDAAEAPPDAHHRLFAMATLATALERVKDFLEAWPAEAMTRTASTSSTAAAPRASADMPWGAELVAGPTSSRSDDAKDSGNQPAAGADVGEAHQRAPLVAPRLPEALLRRTLRTLLANWENPLTQAARMAGGAFDTLLAVAQLQEQQAAPDGAPAAAGGGGDDGEGLLGSIARDLLAMGSDRKGKFAPLAAVAPRLGARTLLRLQPDLLRQTLAAMGGNAACSAAATLWAALLPQLLRECEEAEGDPAEGTAAWRAHWHPPLLSALSGTALDPAPATSSTGLERPVDVRAADAAAAQLRANVSTYALPAALKLDANSLPLLLRELLQPCCPQVAAVLAVLRAARAQALIDDLDDVVSDLANIRAFTAPDCSLASSITGSSIDSSADSRNKCGSIEIVGNSSGSAESPLAGGGTDDSGNGDDVVRVPFSMLWGALASRQEALRVDALQLITTNPRTSSLPGVAELALMRLAVSLAFRWTSRSLRNKWRGAAFQMLTRLRLAAAAAAQRLANGQGGDQGLGRYSSHNSRGAEEVDPEKDAAGLAHAEAFLRWLSGAIAASLHPGAPHARQQAALGLLGMILDVWEVQSDADASGRPRKMPKTGRAAESAAKALAPKRVFAPGFLGESMVQTLLGLLTDSWERLRESAAGALQRLPTPLPGLESPQSVQRLADSATALLASPRPSDSDGGAHILALLLRKYVLGLGWPLTLATFQPQHAAALPNGSLHPEETAPAAGIDGTAEDKHPAHQPRQQDFKSHGKLAVGVAFLDQLCDRLQADVQAAQSDVTAAAQHAIAHGPLLALRYAVPNIPWSDVATAGASVQAAAQACLARVFELMLQAAAAALPALARPQTANTGAEDVLGDDEEFQDMSQQQQEAADAGSDPNSRQRAGELAPTVQLVLTASWLTMKEAALLTGALASSLPTPSPLVEPALWERVGSHLLEVLTALKHNGAIEKTQAGFHGLCVRLLQEADPALSALPQRWLTSLLDAAAAPQQSVDNIIRRSAGGPYAVTAILLAEPLQQSQKVLLTSGVRRLLDMAAGSDAGEPWPRVHALNMLRMAFSERGLALDGTAFLAEGLQAAILAASAPQWEVRNAAHLAFAAMAIRLLGYRNLTPGQVPVPAADLFQRHPQLHAFLAAQLAEAAALLEGRQNDDGGGGGGPGVSQLHPSLLPVLTLLSRLGPSPGAAAAQSATNGANTLAPGLLLPAARACCAAPAAALRVMAASAAAALLPTGQQASELRRLLAGLPQRPPLGNCNEVHGQVLQARALLAVHRKALAGGQLAALCEALRPALWLATGACAPGMVRTDMVRLLHDLAPLLLAVAAPQSAEMRSAVADTCWVQLLRATHASGTDAGDPIRSVWLKELARLCCGPLLPGPVPDAVAGRSREEAMGAVLAAASEELQAAALKACIGPAAADAGLHAWLLPPLVARLSAGEPHHKPLRRALRLATLLLPHAGAEEAAALWQVSHKAFRTSSHPGVRDAALRCCGAALGRLRDVAASVSIAMPARSMGPISAAATAESGAAAVAALPQASASGSVASSAAAAMTPAAAGTGPAFADASAVDGLLEAAEGGSGAAEPPEMRLAVANALAATGLLHLQPQHSQSEVARQHSLRAWLLTLELVEDEDDEVRDAVAAAAGAELDAAAGCSASNAATSGSRPQQLAAASSEVVQPAAFAAVARHFGHCAALHARLLDWICAPQPTGAARAQAPQRLFGREADNQHREALGVAALAAVALQQLLLLPASDAHTQLRPTLRAWLVPLMQAWQQQCKRVAKATQDGANSLGGATQRPEVYEALYRPLLAAWAAVPAFGLAQDSSAAAAGHRSVDRCVPAAGVQPAAKAATEAPPQCAAAADGDGSGADGQAAGAVAAAAAAPDAAAIASSLQGGSAALASLPHIQPQLGNLLALVLRLWCPAASSAEQASMQAAHAVVQQLAGRAFDASFGPLSLTVSSPWGVSTRE